MLLHYQIKDITNAEESQADDEDDYEDDLPEQELTYDDEEYSDLDEEKDDGDGTQGEDYGLTLPLQKQLDEWQGTLIF